MYQIYVNYLAILITAVISFSIGVIWYSPLIFGKNWLKEVGKTKEDLKIDSKPFIYVLSFIAWCISSYVLAVIIDYAVDVFSKPALLFGILTAFLCWFGFVAALSLIHNLFTQRSTILWLIDTGYILVAMLISGAILAEWR
jgi:hypothetical protein